MSQNHQNPMDRQVAQVAARLKDQGVAPGRDLWPDIDAALDKVEQQPLRPRRRPEGRVWRGVALAATLALAVGLGYVGMQGPDGQPADLAVNAGASPLEKLDHTLGELNQALSLDPENRNLSRLVLLVHRSRADILRHNTLNL
jgi:ferric-dicitrate binding protein FerR (iron transport regulator)